MKQTSEKKKKSASVNSNLFSKEGKKRICFSTFTFITFQVCSLLYGFGDVPNPLEETVEYVDMLVVEYINKLCTDASRLAKYRGHVKTEDFLFVLGREPRKLGRAKELLALDKELKRARQAFNVSDFTSKELL